MAETRVVVELSCTSQSDLKKVIYSDTSSGSIVGRVKIELEDGTDITSQVEYSSGEENRIYYTFPAPGRYKLFYSWYGSTSIPDSAFREIGLGGEPRIDVPDNFTSVGNHTFAYASIECLTLGTGITTMYSEVFEWSKLGSLTIKAVTQPSNYNPYYSPFDNTYSIGAFYYPQNSDYSGWISEMPANTPAFPTTPASMASCVSVAPDPPIPSGQTIDSGSTSHTITYSGCPLVFDHSASTGTWNTLPTVTTGGTTNDWWITYDVPANDTDSARTITYYYLRYSGETCEDLIDTVSYTISQAAGSGTPTPSDSYIRFVDSAVTVNGGSQLVYCALDYSGCTPNGGNKSFSATGTLDVTGITVYIGSQSTDCTIRFPQNTGTTPLQADVRVEFDDTSGNTYYDTIHISQGVQVDVNFNPSVHGIQGQANTVTSTAIPVNCTVSSITFSAITYTSGTWDEYPTYTINGNDVTFRVPANDTNAMRILIYNFNITDTDGNVYNKSITITQLAQERWVYLNPSGRTHNANTAGSSFFHIKGSGCSIDSAYTPTFTLSGDTTWIDSIERVYYNNTQSGWTAYYPVSRNLGPSDREIYITANGVHDTDGNVYNGLVYHATQNWSAYTFLNYDTYATSSARTTETAEVVPVNTTICSVEIESAYTYTPNLWEGVEQLTVTLLGNYLTVVWPANPYDDLRHYNIDLRVVWGESCEKSTILSYNKWQNIKSTPTQKDIKAADTDYSVGSGTGEASTTVQVSGCTYDHFSFITGGSFSVTAVSISNSILFYYPENPTNSTRTGYVYITFYDSDGNTYGPQTITFTQQAGSSPGPGPGPDPSTGYVLTTLTISDQEQHRYFVEARPGVVYSAAGQYYKTILACEARYSLYYVNSYGGVDVLPFKEKGWKKSDTITRFNYSRSFRNNTPEFENVNYMNEIKASWELHTGWLSDEQSKRMHELIESTIVYLYDAEEKTYTPVVMTDKKLEYKTYHNQGKKFYNYTVNVEESQSKERR